MTRRIATRNVAAGFVAGLLWLSAGAQAPVSAQNKSVKDRLIGNWKLVSYVVIDQNGNKSPGNYDVGRLVYHPSGEMTAHLMNSKRPTANATTDAARSEAYRTYLGYFGPFTVDEQKGTVTHHVIGSSNPSWAGGDQVRYYALSQNDRRLTLSVKNGDRVTGSLDWDRVE